MKISSAQVRWMIRRDMPELIAIEAESFKFPWVEEDFIKVLRERYSIGMVIENDDKILGYMIYSLEKIRFRLMRFAVHKDYRRQGYGRLMMRKLTGKIDPKRRTKVTLAVPDYMLNTHLFLKEVGFKAIGVDESDYIFEFRK